MRLLSFFIFFGCVTYTGIFAQDLLITNNNDSIPCKIKNIGADGSVYYKSKVKDDLYNGYLKKDFYSGIVIDYYSELKRKNNPNNGLGFFELGLHYTQIQLNPIIDLFIDNEELLSDLSCGASLSLSYQKFISSIAKNNHYKKPRGNLSLGIGYEYFTQKADIDNSDLSADFKRHINSFFLLVSYNTKFKYTTYITFKPGLMFNKYNGDYNGSPLKSKSTMYSVGLGIHQKLVDISRKFSLFITIDPFIYFVQSGKIEYETINYISTIHYPEKQVDYGLSMGLSLKYFY